MARIHSKLQGEEPQIPEVRSEDELSCSEDDESQDHQAYGDYGAAAVGGLNSFVSNVLGSLLRVADWSCHFAGGVGLWVRPTVVGVPPATSGADTQLRDLLGGL